MLWEGGRLRGRKWVQPSSSSPCLLTEKISNPSEKMLTTMWERKRFMIGLVAEKMEKKKNKNSQILTSHKSKNKLAQQETIHIGRET